MFNKPINPYPIFATKRLVLRRMKIEDANEIKLLRSDDLVNEFIGRSGSISLDEAKAFIKLIEKKIGEDDSYYWAITLKDNDSLIGTICLYNISVEKDLAEIGYELMPAFQGKGIMQEAISAIINFSFEQLGLKMLTALSEVGNKKSTTLLLKNNFLPDENFKHVSKAEAEGLIAYYRSRSN